MNGIRLRDVKPTNNQLIKSCGKKKIPNPGIVEM